MAALKPDGLDPKPVAMGAAGPKNFLAPLEAVAEWFDEALGPSDPRPSAATLERLARDLQITVNRRHNLEGAPSVPLKDVDPAEELYKRVRRVQQAAKDVYSVTRELEDYAGSYIWERGGDASISLQEFQDVLAFVSLAPVPLAPWPSRPPARGRPIKPWHDAGREFARMVRAVMGDIGYSKRLKATDEESVTAIVGAKAISWAYDIEIQPKGFATAMRTRDRRKGRRLGRSFFELFPDAKRITVA